MSWTNEKVEKLKELWGKGSTASQIAEIIGGLRNIVTSSDKVEENTRKTVSTIARDSNWPLITSDKLVSNRVNYTPKKG